MLKIPNSDAVNEDGEPIDVIENLRAKKEIFNLIVPTIYDMVKESLILDDGTEEEKAQAEEHLESFRKIGKSIGVDLDSPLTP